MDCPFIVGQRVVCVQDLRSSALNMILHYGVALSIPQVKDIVRIRAIKPSDCPCGNCPDQVGLLLHEHHNPPINGLEPVFVWTCFRPLQDRPKEADTDISLLLKLADVNNHRTPKPTSVPSDTEEYV